ncbi:MAG TPA: tetratricopeptide repeat protein [Blastocatellia bacterium]|jgi:tetratricopeptide (TPR) repeat protein
MKRKKAFPSIFLVFPLWLCGSVANSIVVLFPLLSFSGDAFAQRPLPAPLEKLFARGVEALKSGDLETAEKTFSEALRHGVKHPLVYHNLGVISQQRGDHRRAVAYFRAAIRLQPKYGPSRLLIGSSLLALGNNAEAARELERAVNLLPDEPQARLLLARAYEGSGDRLAALKEYQKLVEVAPREAEYAYQLGGAYMKLSEWCYQRIARLDSKSARLSQSLGQEYLSQGKYDLAIGAYQQAARSDPKLPEIHLALALIYLELKRYDDAMAEIELELRLVPESKTAEEAKKKIEAAKTAPSQ